MITTAKRRDMRKDQIKIKITCSTNKCIGTPKTKKKYMKKTG